MQLSMSESFKNASVSGFFDVYQEEAFTFSS